jgi:hypothetical protein
MATRDLTAQRLRELLHYDPDTGVFTWRASRGRARRGAAAGMVNHHGYVEIGIDNIAHRAHRLAWLWVHGQWPAKHIDHINGDMRDNRLCNLRDVDRVINMQNMKRARVDNKSGLLGVCECKRSGRWIASIGFNGKQHRIGRFDTPELAHEAYLYAKRRLHQGGTL